MVGGAAVYSHQAHRLCRFDPHWDEASSCTAVDAVICLVVYRFYHPGGLCTGEVMLEGSCSLVWGIRVETIDKGVSSRGTLVSALCTDGTTNTGTQGNAVAQIWTNGGAHCGPCVCDSLNCSYHTGAT